MLVQETTTTNTSDLQNEIAGLEAALIPTLTEKQQALLEELREEDRNALFDLGYQELYEMVDAIARHFPGFAPAIRALAPHIWESTSHDEDLCGLVKRAYPAQHRDPRCLVGSDGPGGPGLGSSPP